MSARTTESGVIILPHGQLDVLAERCGISTVTARKYLRGGMPRWSKQFAKQEEVRKYALKECGGSISKI